MNALIVLSGSLLALCTFLLLRQILVMRGAEVGAGAGLGMVGLLYLWVAGLALFICSIALWLSRTRIARGRGPSAGRERRIPVWAWCVLGVAVFGMVSAPFARAALRSRGIADATFAAYCRSLGVEPPAPRAIQPDITFKGFETDYIYTVPGDASRFPVHIRTDVFGKGHVIGAGEGAY